MTMSSAPAILPPKSAAAPGSFPFVQTSLTRRNGNGAGGGVGGVAVLFARRDSIYKTMPGLDVWDIDRDARNYQGPHPVVTHPPCRGWGCLRMNAKHTEEEKALGPWAVEQVRKWGGVLEHPRGSTLWKAAGLPKPGPTTDAHGGFSIAVEQFAWGHRAQKATWLYICGVPRSEVPSMPMKFEHPQHVVTNIHGLRAGMLGYRKEITKREREATPPAFAAWLVELAGRAAGAGVWALTRTTEKEMNDQAHPTAAKGDSQHAK